MYRYCMYNVHVHTHMYMYICTYNHTLYKYSRIHYKNTVCICTSTVCTYTGTYNHSLYKYCKSCTGTVYTCIQVHIIIHYTSTVAHIIKVQYIDTVYRYHRLGNFLCSKISLVFLIHKH